LIKALRRRRSRLSIVAPQESNAFPFQIDDPNAPEAVATLEVQTADGSFQAFQFELDSGAYISTLPASAAKVLGLSITAGSKITLAGVDGQSFDVYVQTLTVRFKGSTTVFPLPIAISLSEVPMLLGRFGFWPYLTSINIDQITKATVFRSSH
jgi:hypothetical protein